MARRIRMNNTDVILHDGSKLFNEVKKNNPSARQATVCQTDGSIEVVPVTSIDRIDPQLVTEIQTNQTDIEQGR